MKLFLVEWYKLKNHRFFWIGMGLFVFLLVILLFSIGQFPFFNNANLQESGEQPTPTAMLPKNLADAGFYQLPYLWHHATYMAGYFKFIPAFLLLFFLTNEYQYRTLRQNIIDGMSRRDFFWSKMSSVLLYSLISVLVLVLSVLILGLIHNDNLSGYFSKGDFLLAYFGEMLFVLCFTLFAGLLLKRTGITVILLLLYYYLAEPLMGYMLNSSLDFPLGDYLPTRPSRDLITQPFTRLFALDDFIGTQSLEKIARLPLALTFVYSGLMAWGSYWLLQKRDL